MDVTPSTPTPKRSRSKTKTEAAPKKEPAKKAVTAATPVKTKKARVAPPAVQSIETLATTIDVVSTANLSLIDLQHEIAMAAYFLAERRNFTPGHELDDWLQAERQVREARTV